MANSNSKKKTNVAPPAYNISTSPLGTAHQIAALKAEKAAIVERQSSEKQEWQLRHDVAKLEKDEAYGPWRRAGEYRSMKIQNTYARACQKYEIIVKEKEDVEFRIRKIDLEVRRLEISLSKMDEKSEKLG